MKIQAAWSLERPRVISGAILTMSQRVSKADFARLVEQALEELPEPFASHLEQMSIEIKDRPTRRQLRQLDLADYDLLLGLHEGVPMTGRSVEHSGTLPTRIFVFQESLEQVCDSERELIAEIRKTVLH
ncbi:MAG: metallopeptidase family protein, partial [Chthoniobacterales bacterium]|nr:metallopeptidase family protein [Chthoniobacterales bacterium]